MAIDGIISAIASLDWDRVEQTPRGEVYEVCNADEEDWKLFLDSEAPETECGKMELIEGKIVIVEFPSVERGAFMGAFSRFLTHDAVIDTYMRPRPAVRTQNYEADLSFAPTPQTGAALPRGLRWTQWHTLRIEIGYSRGWGHRRGQLDWKANRWATIPGVNYVICVAVEDGLTSATYKLYRVPRQNDRLHDQDPISIEAPRTTVILDSQVLLGMSPRARLPTQPPVPARLAIDLYATLEYARVGF
ncbi:hypothetical protein PF005_g9842 [Phytophthora fragariae]|uniref:Uncharacterized protein n=1 Tax=Phytophthora fragariae TaxID=53985 RepID=A0A6A3ZN92_9STRA|nr:hypothetical protein PF003_g5911 [Phytophthora fragariae]KAE8939048.1 hypothetical protein PF009_g11105 [Phytophthora fragariae]KAE8994520.1 hypothetical protein PF011_g16704 [Phytophthora fragariae]KAE9115401.1 hypothetical protein PF007_g10050 [Phytophthora fragariae]KAE9115409.1 hypothetical protein PF010_g9346 [Phytophthora fragariae]